VPAALGADLLNAASFLVRARRAGAPALAGLAALALCACGRIGPLEPPPNPNAPSQTAAAASPDQVLAPQAKPKIPPITPPQQPFILDPLLK